MRWPLFVLGMPALLLSALPAHAQAVRVPPVEVGGQIGAITLLADGVQSRLAGGPHLTWNISQDHALEAVADAVAPTGGGTYGFYLVQYKGVIWRPSAGHGRVFSTLGTGGYFEHSHVKERQIRRPDGSIAVFPAHSEGELSHPNIAKFGVGVEHALNRHVAGRAEADVFGVVGRGVAFGFRFSGGLSIPIGGFRAN